MGLPLPKLPKILPKSRQQLRDTVYRQLMRQDAQMGGTLFGPIPDGHRREFFCLDEHTWVWHEEWTDKTGKAHAVTTRYDIRPDGILKSQGNNSYQRVQGAELSNLYEAALRYRDRVYAEYLATQSA